MKLIAPVIIAIAICATSSAALSKIGVSKTVSDEAGLEAFADQANLGPFSKLPDVGPYDISLEIEPNIDSRAYPLGAACVGTYRQKTMVSTFAERIATRWDANNDLQTVKAGAAAVKLRITDTGSTERCVKVSEFDSVCFARTQIKGEVQTRDSGNQLVTMPIRIEIERQIPQGIICLNFNNDNSNGASFYALRYNGDRSTILLINREAVIAFVEEAKRKLNTVVTAQR